MADTGHVLDGARPVSYTPTAAWTVAVALPMAGLALLVAQASLDAELAHQPIHFWLVLTVAALNVGLGLLTSEAARRRGDARLLLVSLAFLVSAGFLGLHALATPGVLLDKPNAGFVIATPVGLLIASGFAAASSLEISAARSAALVRRQRLLLYAVAAGLLAWGLVSVASLPPLRRTLTPDQAYWPLRILAVVGVGAYAFAALRYYLLYRRRRSDVLLGVITAFVLLAEAMVAVALSRNWHLSWWEWHVLMALAFGLVAYSARLEYRRGSTVPGAFAGLYLDHTLGRFHETQSEALKALVEFPDRAAEVRARYGLGAEEAEALARAASEVRHIDQLFRPYLSPQLAARLREAPEAGELGGERRYVSILFADLEGFTSFSERATPEQVMAMLNEYWGRAAPVVLRAYEGVIERFAGDAVMVVFNAAADQPDHARRAAGAALALQREAVSLAAEHPGWPRFRVGVNTGPAVVGHVGTAEQRSFAAIGDTTNLAARLQSTAEPGQVVIGGTTYAALGERATVERLPPLRVKGKADPVEAFVLADLEPERDQSA